MTSPGSPSPNGGALTTWVDRYGPWALVLGGSEGIGASFARLLAADGINVVLAARRTQPMAELAGQLETDTGVSTRTVAIDLTAVGAVSQLADTTSDLEIGLLIYNAGATHGVAPFHDKAVDAHLGLVSLNCISPLLACHHFGAAMLQRGRGGIMLVGSMAGTAGSALNVTYSAVKAFEQVFAEGLWYEMRPHGVDVLALLAGATRTPSLERSGTIGAGSKYPPMEPDDVAREGLANLGNGPVWVAGDTNRAGFDYLRSVPRRDAVTVLSKAARAFSGLASEPAD